MILHEISRGSTTVSSRVLPSEHSTQCIRIVTVKVWGHWAACLAAAACVFSTNTAKQAKHTAKLKPYDSCYDTYMEFVCLGPVANTEKYGTISYAGYAFAIQWDSAFPKPSHFQASSSCFLRILLVRPLFILLQETLLSIAFWPHGDSILDVWRFKPSQAHFSPCKSIL